MQKKIIALAVAALASSAAFAQSNVTVYGIADAYLASSKTDQASRQNQVQSGGLAASRLGFKGVEDLGNGLKALFVLETAVNLDQQGTVGAVGTTGNSGLFGATRQSMVGLTGGFGTAVAGRLQTAAYDWAVKYDVLAGTAFSPLQNVTGNASVAPAGANNFLIGGTARATRSDNAVAYISPTFSGLTLAYNHGEVTEQGVSVGGTNVHADLFGANYAMGPVAVGGVYARLKNDASSNVAGTADKTVDWSLGATYDLKVAKLGATYQRSKTDGNGAAGTATNTDTAWSLGVVVPVTAAGNVIASYAKNNIKSTTADDNTKSWTVAYTHSLSKRTTAYAGYNSISRNNGIAFAVAGANAGTNVVNGADTGTFVVGMNHKF